jgi:uncharacterized cupin superfamily protein
VNGRFPAAISPTQTNRQLQRLLTVSADDPVWLMPKKLPLTAVPVESECSDPSPFDRPCLDQSTQRPSRHAHLTQFGVNLTVIRPGAWSSQRHWHSHEDELVWVLGGELTLVTNGGDEVLRAGDCAAFGRGDPNGHHLVNKSSRPASVLEIGNSDPKDGCVYSDSDMIAEPGEMRYRRRDGTQYPPKK